jgi:hypothetical protein
MVSRGVQVDVQMLVEESIEVTHLVID